MRIDHFPAEVPALTDGVVRLRGATEADLPAIVALGRDLEMVRWTTVPYPYGPDDARTFLDLQREGWLAETGRRHWAIEIIGGPAVPFAGMIDVRPPEKSSVAWEVGFASHPAARGRGAMTRAVRLVAAWLFERAVPRLYYTALPDNWRSRRVAWACGFTMHATLPDRIGSDRTGPTDAVIGSLAAGDPMRPRNRWIMPPDLWGATVRLRQWRDEDVEAMEEPDHPAHFMPAGVASTPSTFGEWLTRRRSLMADGAACAWCIADRQTDRALGDVNLFTRFGPIEDHAELGYQLLPSARGRGAAREAARLAVAHAFGPVGTGGLGLRRLVAETAAGNAASNAVLRRLGFTEFGREHEVDDVGGGRYEDGLHWELLARRAGGSLNGPPVEPYTRR